jgi:hypothetical protein
MQGRLYSNAQNAANLILTRAYSGKRNKGGHCGLEFLPSHEDLR